MHEPLRLAGWFWFFCWLAFCSGAARRAGQLVAAVAAFILWLVARKGHVIDAGRVLKGAPGRSLSFRWACIWWYTDCVTPD